MTELLLSYDPSLDEYWRTRFHDVFGQDHECHVLNGSGYTDGQAFIDALLAGDEFTSDMVLVVLIGPRTHELAQVDWEIAAALQPKPDRPSGLLGIRLPTHPDHGKNTVNPNTIPRRFSDNLKSGYVNLYDWTESISELGSRVTKALRAAHMTPELLSNDRAPMKASRRG